MALSDRIQEFLQRLTPVTRGSLLTELERLEVCGAEIPGAAPVLEKLRAEFRGGWIERKSASAIPRDFSSLRWSRC